jgi:hypothetical protein
MEKISTSSNYVPHLNYNLSKNEGDMQRYFIYKKVIESEIELLKGECRKCSKTVSRTGRSTSSMIDHEERCDKDASKLYKAASKSRKSNSGPSTPIYTDKRNRLTSEHANMQLFLHHHYKYTD